MRCLLVLIIALVGMGAGTGAATAQEATPASGDVASVARTNVRYFLPYTPDGLASGLTVTETVSGICAESSLADLGRPDAWTCSDLETSERYDPCFENPFGPMEEVEELVCATAPFDTDVVGFTLTEPLQRFKDLDRQGMAPGDGPDDARAPDQAPDGYGAAADPMAGMDESMAAPEDMAEAAVHPLDIPWALELANAERCTLLTGATAVLAGERINYGCEGGGMVFGEVNRDGPLWTVSYLAEDAFASDLVAVTVAWT